MCKVCKRERVDRKNFLAGRVTNSFSRQEVILMEKFFKKAAIVRDMAPLFREPAIARVMGKVTRMRQRSDEGVKQS